MDILQGLNITDITGTGLLLIIAIKLTRFDMIIKSYSAIIKKITENCPLFSKNEIDCIKNNKTGGS